MNLKFVNCDSIYWDFVRVLRNDPNVMSGFIKNTHISKKEQNEYMIINSQYYYICLLDNMPVGYVGVLDDDIRICVDPKFQKMKIGEYMVKEIIKKFPNAIAKIKIDNVASIKLFENCGFELKYYLYEKDN